MEESAKTVEKSINQTAVETDAGGTTLLTNVANGGGDRNQRNIGMLMDLDLPVSVELGRIQMMVKEILELGPGALIELNKFSGEPVDIYVNDKKFAEGEVVVIDQNFGVRLTALIGPDERLMNLK